MTIKRDDKGRPICGQRSAIGTECQTPVHPGYTICYQCKRPYRREQIEAALERPENASFRVVTQPTDARPDPPATA